MRDIQFSGGDFYYMSDYGQLLESFEYEMICEAHDDDYQGSSLHIFKNGDEYGFLTFGWGSCSGCDALQDCHSKAEVTDLRNSLHKDIIWKGSRAEMNAYLDGKDWATHLYCQKATIENLLKQWRELS